MLEPPQTPTKSYDQALAEYFKNPDAFVCRVRKAKAPLATDAAGSAIPSTDMMARKCKPQGVDFSGVTDLLAHHEEGPPAGVKSPAFDSYENFRPSTKRVPHCVSGNFAGAGIGELKETPARKPIFKASTASPLHDTGRVLAWKNAPLKQEPAPSPKWEHDKKQAAAVSHEVEEMKTARVVTKQPTIARKAYLACLEGNNDVFQYRHSAGICPDNYKFDSQRPATAPRSPAPAATQRPATARDSFFDANRQFSYNRVRGQASQITLS